MVCNGLPINYEELEADAFAHLVKMASYDKLKQLQEEILASFFRKGFKWYVKQKLKTIRRQMNKKQKFISITKADGEDRDFHDSKQDWLDGDVIDYTGCPYPEYVRRIYVDREPVIEVFPDEYDRKVWYTKMLPEIKEYFRKLYDYPINMEDQ